MEQDKETTKVLFRVVKRGDFKGQVDAVMPYIAGDYNPSTCTCYAHIGQHSSGEVRYFQEQTRNATEQEFRDLKRELEAAPFGYRFEVLKRFPNNARAERLKQINHA